MFRQSDTRAAAALSLQSGLPPRAGVGFKPIHFQGLLEPGLDLGFLEVHAENYMGAGGPPHAQLSALREIYPLSIHGVGLSIGGIEPLDEAHLARLARLVARYEPREFSEHLAWSTHDGHFFNDLLPPAYDTPTLLRVVQHVDQTQERLGRRILIENPSTYVAFERSTWAEADFISEVARRAGCGLLLDVNNVMVSCVNHGHDPYAYLEAFPVHAVREMHLAGYAEDKDSLGTRLLIDAHNGPVAADVWPLYRRALALCGPVPTLIEWDNAVPTLEVLLGQAERAEH
ncbi:MAG: DUF692 domain-containing protein, partial [Alphaproteobacteria bacterium]|nr:DUF692 domain-containing protein [Alphaproteobacteria bacterium]